MREKILLKRVNIMLYVSGFFIAAFGVFLMKSSTLGLGPWGVAALELTNLFKPYLSFFTFGMAASIHTYLMIFFVLIAKKNLKSAFVFISVLLINGTVDFYDYVVFPNWIISQPLQAVLSHGSGFLAYCLGSALLILSGFPGLVIEEFTLTLMKLLNLKHYPLVRTFVAYFGFVLAVIYGWASGTNASAITWLSLVLGVAFGPVIGWMVKLVRQVILTRFPKTQLSNS